MALFKYRNLMDLKFWLVPTGDWFGWFHWFHHFFGQYLCYHLESFQILLTGDRSYHYLKDATLFALLSDKSAEIFKCKYSKNWNLPPGCLPHGVFICKWGRSDVTQLICIWKQTWGSVLAMRPVWRIGKYFNFLPLISQRSYQITSQMRWHPLGTDKTLLQ